jgi:hypothetical protein
VSWSSTFLGGVSPPKKVTWPFRACAALKRFNIVYDYPRDNIIAWPSKYFTTPDAFVPPGSQNGQRVKA